MNSEEIYDGITDVRDELVEKAGEPLKKRPVRRYWVSGMAALLAVAILIGGFLRPHGGPLTATAYAIAQAEYPQMAPHPKEEDYTKPTGEFDDEGYMKASDAWWNSARAQYDQPEGYTAGMETFLESSVRQFLSGEEGENRAYSPLNVYMALSMLAELTGGESQAQILTLLGAGDIDALRRQAASVWNANYQEDGMMSSVLASSLWLREGIRFVPETLETLAKTYYASSFQGEMGSADFDKALQDWLNQQTGGLLEEQAAGVHLDPETILALATTVYYRAKWMDEFSESQTSPETFHAPEGDVECPFMHQTIGIGTYYWGEKFSMISKPLGERGDSMWFILPDEGVRAEELLEDPQAMAVLSRGNRDELGQKGLKINFSLPKFDIAAETDLIPGLKALGITDVFDPAVSDFSPMTKDVEEIYLSQAQHAVRVAVDEEGCTAAAYTVMAMTGSGMPPEEEVDFTVNRPFLFAITGREGQPLFVGIVNRP